MEFNPTKCKVKMGQSERKPKYVYHLARSKSQESACNWDLGVDIIPSISPEHPIRRIVKEAN